jgi:hypothetical protein
VFAVADKATFWNCLVAMRPRTLKVELPSSYDIKKYIHKQFIICLKDLKELIAVSLVPPEAETDVE